MADNEWWTAEQVAEYLGVPLNTLYQWRSRQKWGGGPPAYGYGKKLRYRPDDVKAWMEQYRNVRAAEDRSDPKRLADANRKLLAEIEWLRSWVKRLVQQVRELGGEPPTIGEYRG